MTQAIYPGTFDPITHGHTDSVQRAQPIVRLAAVAVAGSTWKQQTAFTLEERVALVRVALHGIERVEVRPFDGLLVETARAWVTTVIRRGTARSRFRVRAADGGEHEPPAACRGGQPLVTPAEDYAFLSARPGARDCLLGGEVGLFVHPEVAQRPGGELRAGKR